MSNDDNKSDPKAKKPYAFGEFEIASFEKVLKSYSNDLKMMDVYAIIPANDAHGNDLSCDRTDSPTDPC
jgi:hypothetical protein